MRLFFMNSGQARARLVKAGAAFLAAALIAGCGNNYRPVVTPVTPSGPAAQPSSYTVVVSAPSSTTAGVASIIDYSGDTLLAEAPVGVNPVFFSIDETGTLGVTYNSDHTVTNFPVSSLLQTKLETTTTLLGTADPVNFYTPVSSLWAADLTGNVADVFTGTPETFKVAVPVGTLPVPAVSPVTVIGNGNYTAQRNYVVSQNFLDPTGAACNTAPTTASSGVPGTITPVETASYAADTPISVGYCPVYAVMSADANRIFVLNRGGDATNAGGSITVINSQSNALDSCTPYQSQNGQWVTCHASIPLPAGPVYAEFNKTTQQLVVANYDSNTISVIDVTLDQYGNDYNTYSNPTCTVKGVNNYANCGTITGGFGTTYTIPVGTNPASVTALADGSRAYTANQGDGTVTIVNLTDHTVEKTLTVVGHPRTVVSTQNSLYGKVYVASPDSPYLTIISTLNDLVDTTLLVEGNIVDVRVSTQNGTTGNNNDTSRMPGMGEPCNLPPSLEPAPTGSQTAGQVCREMPQ
jgi:DNA-binding beta-propeller fold protein YncE